MNILGVSAGFSHDASACILQDGKIKFAIEEERIIRKKYAEHKIPIHSIKACLDYCKLTPSEIDYIAISWNPYKFNNECLTPSDDMFVKALLPYSIYGNYKSPKVHIVDHHISHAAHVFWNSPFENACILVMDGTGELSSGTILCGCKNKGIKELYTFDVGESLGYFYQAASSYCGLGYMGSGKLMGLAAYGKRSEFVFDNIYLSNEKGYYINNKSISFENNMKYWYEIFSHNKYTPNFFAKKEIFTSEYIDFASKVQNTLNNVMVNVAIKAMKATNYFDLCISGGVSMNTASNLCIMEETNANRCFTFAGGGDAGTSLGAAMHAYFEITGHKSTPLKNAYLGSELQNDTILSILSNYKIDAQYYDNDKLIDIVSQYLERGLSVGIMEGREEFGSRALGNRSILYNPQIKNGKDILNRIKKREYWRPFAPMILSEYKDKYLINAYDSPYMTTNFKVTPKGVESLPGAIHIDKTCRPQISFENNISNKILNKFCMDTGCGGLINTSFNTKGNPIVHTVDDALKEYFSSALDVLVIGNYCLIKNAKER